MNRTRTALSAALATAGVAAATVVGSASPAMAAVDPCVQRVVVSNNSAAIISYVLNDRTGVATTPSAEFPVTQVRATDLPFTSYAEGTDVRPIVTAQGGDPTPAGQFVSFCNNGQTATYTVTGTISSLQVVLIGG